MNLMLGDDGVAFIGAGIRSYLARPDAQLLRDVGNVLKLLEAQRSSRCFKFLSNVAKNYFVS